MKGFEPSRISAPVPKTGVATITPHRQFAGYRLTCGVDIITHLRCFHQRFFCDPEAVRTPGPYIKSVLLYQLSYEVIKLERGDSNP